MALTNEIISANESLKDLSEEQKSAIVTLSQNSEDELFRERMGDHYRKLDASIEEHSGVARNGDEKTYDYLPRAIDAMKAKYEASLKTLRDENSDLKNKASQGGDAALKSQLESAQKELETTKSQFNALKESADAEKANYQKAIMDFKIETEISRAMEGIKLKGGLNDAAMRTLVSQAITNVKSKNPSFEDRGGEQRLVFHDENGSPLNNAENKLNPFTAKELLIKELESLDILDHKPAQGGGGKGNLPSQTVMTASTQIEATELITKSLMEKGFVRGTDKFQTEFNKMWEENNVKSLPLK